VTEGINSSIIFNMWTWSNSEMFDIHKYQKKHQAVKIKKSKAGGKTVVAATQHSNLSTA